METEAIDTAQATIIASIIAGLVALVTSFAGYAFQQRRAHAEQEHALKQIRGQLRADLERDQEKLKADLQADFQRDREGLRTQFMAEQVARRLLQEHRWPLRSFKILQHHLGGFTEDELRRILVRTGAVRFQSRSGLELWGLVDRNEDRLSVWKVDAEPETIPWGELYGSAAETQSAAD